jgi:hypothetical protein
VALAEHGEEVVDHAPHVRDVDLDVHVRRRVERQDDVVGARGVLHCARELEAAARDHALEHLLRARLRERHLAACHLVEHGLLALHSDRREAAVRERQREGQPDSAEADDGDARFHARESRAAGSGTGGRTPARSAG